MSDVQPPRPGSGKPGEAGAIGWAAHPAGVVTPAPAEAGSPYFPDESVPPRPEGLPELADHPRYRVVQPLGQGGMGAVYKAEHRVMKRAVALKVIAANLV